MSVAEYTLPSGDFHSQWHRFAVDWEPGTLRWTVDDVPFQTVERAAGEYWPFDAGHEFFILLNLAVGGWFDPGHPPPPDLEPQRLLVDYVRVYQRRASEEAEP